MVSYTAFVSSTWALRRHRRRRNFVYGRSRGSHLPARDHGRALRMVPDPNGIQALRNFLAKKRAVETQRFLSCNSASLVVYAFSRCESETQDGEPLSTIQYRSQPQFESIWHKVALIGRRCHLTVRILPSQGRYTGSIPVSATKHPIPLHLADANSSAYTSSNSFGAA
jgi:hypothetical protein